MDLDLTREMRPRRPAPAVTNRHGGVRVARRSEGAGSPPEAPVGAWARHEHQDDQPDEARTILPPPLAREIPSKEIEGSSPAVVLGPIPAIGEELERGFCSGVKLGVRGGGETWWKEQEGLGGELAMAHGEVRLGRHGARGLRKRKQGGGCLPGCLSRGDAPGGVSNKEELEERGARCASAGARQVLEEGGGGPGQLREVTGKEGGPGERGLRAIGWRGAPGGARSHGRSTL